MSIISCENGDFNLTILHTNDIHAHLEESNKFGGTCFEEDKNKSKCVGGVARIVHKVKEIRNETPDALFVNAGDFFQGTPYYTLFKQSVISEIMSVMGYDYACLGNHEFDDGPANLAPFLEKLNQSKVTFVGTNTNFSEEPLFANCNLVTSAIKEINDRKIGILGAVIPSTQYGSSPGKGYPDENKPEGPYPYVVNRSDGSRALVVQDFCFGKFLGRLDVTFNSTGHVVEWGRKSYLSERFHPGRTRQIPPAWSDINGAVVNAGSIRTALPSFYNVTWGDVVTTLPYGNSLVTLTLTGTDLWRMFENSVTKYNTSKDKSKGRFLQVSGFRVQYDLTNDDNRVKSIDVLCANCSVPIYEHVHCDKTYKIVAVDFIARGGDGYKFANSVIVSDVGPIEYEALEKYIVKMSPMWTPNEGRIKITWNQTDKEAVENYTRMMRDNQTCQNGVCTLMQ
ncbi:hypothetical protein MTO96_008070 [Rhipicephalus appendiculatus]